MRATSLIAFAALAIGAQAQQDFGAQLVAALRTAGLTGVAEVVGGNAQLVTALQGSNKTILAPTNEALAASSLPTGDQLSALISYHVLEGTFSAEAFDDNDGRPVRTLLTQDGRASPQVVLLDEGVAISGKNMRSNLVSQPNGPTVANVQIQSISAVLSVPSNFVQVIVDASGETGLRQVLQGTALTRLLIDLTGTIFVPQAEAFSAAASGALATASIDDIRGLVLNHVINGTVIYANQLTQDGNDKVTRATSASGQELRFEEAGDDVFVILGSTRARIVQSNLLAEGGVVHVIDAALLGTGSAPAATNGASVSGTQRPAPTSTDTAATPSRTGSPDGALKVNSLSALIAFFSVAASVLALA